MAWKIEEVHGKDKAFPESRGLGQEGIVTFTSKTRVGLYEEIDRFIEEIKPQYLSAQKRKLVPWYGIPPRKWGDSPLKKGEKAESRWVLEMYATGYVKD